jgi:enoyl-CoA hydratase
MSDLATLTKQGEVSIIKLDDGKANAFSFDMLESLNACLADVPKDSGSLVITGREGLFSAGFDLKTLASGDVEAAIKMTKLGFNTLLDLYSFPRPIVAAVSGHAVALGIFVTCCCDYRIGIEGKFICQANEVRNNMDIPVQIMEIVRDRLDKKHFYKAIYHAEVYPMHEAVAAGYIDEIVPSDQLMDKAIEKAEDLATLGHPFYKNTKDVYQKDIVAKIKEGIEGSRPPGVES